MFDSIVVRRHGDGQQLIDVGLVAETLLFYDHIHIVADDALLRDLLLIIGPQTLVRLIKEKILTVTFTRGLLAVTPYLSSSGIQFHDIGILERVSEAKKRLGNKATIQYLIEDVLGKSRQTRKIINQLIDEIQFRTWGVSKSLPNGFPALAREDLRDANFVKRGVEHTIRTLVPNALLPNDWAFDLLYTEAAGFMVSTNLDFVELNDQYHKIYPPEHSTLNSAYLLTILYDACADAYLSAEYMSEILTNPIASGIIDAKFHNLLTRRELNRSQIQLFQNLFS